MTKQEKAPDADNAVATRPQKLIVQDTGVNAHLFDTARFEQCWRIAEAMALAELIPDHLRLGRDKRPLDGRRVAGNCLLVVNQAIRWGMDPFAIAPETYAVGGKLAYQGKLVAAVVNARAGLKERLRYDFKGSGDDRTVRVSGTFVGETEPRTIELSVRQGKTQNDMWRKDPDQKLIYSGALKWARRHCPEIVLGVVTEDDLDRLAAGAPLEHAEYVDSGRGIKGESVQDALGPKKVPAKEESPTETASTPATEPPRKKKKKKRPQPPPPPQDEPDDEPEDGDDEPLPAHDEDGEVIEEDDADGADDEGDGDDEGGEEDAEEPEADGEDDAEGDDGTDAEAEDEEAAAAEEDGFSLGGGDKKRPSQDPPRTGGGRGVSEALQAVLDDVGKCKTRGEVSGLSASLGDRGLTKEEIKLAQDACEEKFNIIRQRAQDGVRRNR